jgi:hypothetical protein
MSDIELAKLQVASSRFLAEVYHRAEDIDPNDERDWYDLALGFLLACEVPPEIAEGEPCLSLSCGELPEEVRP